MRKDTPASPDSAADPGRRRLLRLAASPALYLAGAGLAGAAGLGGIAGLVGCGGGRAGPAGTRVALSALPEGVRVQVRHMEQPVELLRTERGVTARSLVCTHMGCVVRWDEGRGIYVCPCHKGEFDPEGRVLGGPPTKPLRELPVTLTADAVWIGGADFGGSR